MTEETYFELERDAIADLAGFEEIDGSEDCDFSWTCPCPRCNGQKYVSPEEALMKMLSPEEALKRSF